MGKAQSKRSVDITTETKKGAEDEVTEKMEKIEDLDKKEVLNGDATLEEKHDPQKKDNEEVENDKDMTTEKNVDIQAGGDSTEASKSAETPKDEGESATAEEISPLADENAKKSKKEKVKKKWSFRSISFGKKDKQKPSKNEEALDDGTPAINGAETDEKSSNETEDPQKEKNVNEEVEKSTENRENGDASQQELNGTEHKEEMTSEEKSNVTTANLTNNTTTERCAPVQSDTTVEPTEQSEKTEPTVTSTTNNETNISENNTTIEVPKNGNGEFEELNATEHDLQKPDVTTASVETSTEKKITSTDATNELSASTNGEKIHQNGDNIDQEIVEQSKAQIEVNSKTENKVFAATLDSFPSTSINPSNAQIHIKDLNASTKNVDENFKINIDEPVIPKFSDIERVNCPIIIPTSSISESVETVEGTDCNKQVEESALLPIEIIETETTLVAADKISEPSPPPLPISPPPSQVSVFVFTNNEESVEDSLSTNSPKPDDSAINEESKEILFTHLEVLPDSASLKTDIPENNESHTYETTNMNIEVITDESVENKLIEEETSNEEIMCTNSLSNKLRNEEEISIAAAVINEITEHAAEIVNHHLEIKEYESLQKTDLIEDSNDKIENEVENVDHKGLAEDNNAGECSNDKSAEYLIESAIVSSQTIDSITDSSLTFSPPESTQAQNEVISLSVEER